jgi:ATP-dependent protease ClpP protease subunit
LTEINLFGHVGWDITVNSVSERLKDVDKGDDLTVNLFSFGGEVYEALAVYGYLAEYNPIIKIVGMAASAASVIALAGKKILIEKNAYMLIHNPWTYAVGDEDDLDKAKDRLKILKNTLLDMYERQTGLNRDVLSDIMDEDNPLSAKDALGYNLVDEIYEAKQDEEEAMDKLQNLLILNSMRRIYDKSYKNNSNVSNNGANVMIELNKLKANVATIEAQVNAADPVDGMLKPIIDVTQLLHDQNQLITEHEELQNNFNDKESENTKLKAEIADLKKKNDEHEVDNILIRNKAKFLPADEAGLKDELMALRQLPAKAKLSNGKTLFENRVEQLEAQPESRNNLMQPTRHAQQKPDPDLNADEPIDFATADWSDPEVEDAANKAALAMVKEGKADSYEIAIDSLRAGGQDA